MNQLFSDDEGPAPAKDTQLTINEHYAKAFEYRKEREELERLKAKYGSDYDPDASGSEFSTDSESAESEDEHGEELTPAVDAAILRTLARIKKKDPGIYDSEKNIFGEEKEKIGSTSAAAQPKSKSKSKPVTLRQVNMEAMLNTSRSSSPDDEPRPLTHVQEQEALRRETIAAFHGAAAQVGDDDILIPREKTKDEREREEEEYRAFLEREVGDLKELVTLDADEEGDEDVVREEEEETGEADGEGASTEKKKKKKKKKKKSSAEGGSVPTKKTRAEQDQDFLLNYILNRGWIDKSEGHVPTYNEVTSLPKERRKKKGKEKAETHDADGNIIELEDDEENDAGLLSDTSFESLASYFETSYNHRFEEPGAAVIPSFPRNLPSVVRREDTTRKDARERRKERKEQELQTKREEVKRLKALKMREVKRKLELIGKQGGLKKTGGDGLDADDAFVDEALRELDLEGEWDPEKHDRQMAGLFDRSADAFEDGDDFGGEDFEDDVDNGVRYDANGKPLWDDDVDIGDIPISDDDANIVFAASPRLSKKEKKKKKKKKDAADNDGVDIDAMDADVAPQFDADEEWDGTEEMRKRKFNEYMDEIYGLDFNDLIGDLPTRFKYVPVQTQTYALTPAEILMATDQELNEYMSVKKYAPYRQDKGDRHRWNPKTQEKLHEIKAKVGERIGTTFASTSGGRARGDGNPAEKPKKRIGKKERMKLKAALGGGAEGDAAAAGAMDEDTPRPDALREADRSNKTMKRKRENQEPSGASETQSGKADGGAEGAGDANDISQKKKRKRRRRTKEEAAQA